MLDTDMCLAFKKLNGDGSTSDLLAANAKCCSWVSTGGATKTGVEYPIEDYCGIINFNGINLE